MSDIDTIRRIVERGLKQAQSRQDDYVDLWQHSLDELYRLQKAHPEYSVQPSDTIRTSSHNERFNDWWESLERNEFVGVSQYDAKRIWLAALDSIGTLK